MTLIVGLSWIGLLAFSAHWARKTRNWRRFALDAGGLVIFAAFLYALFGFPFPRGDVIAKGPQDDLIVAAALYVCVLVGMLAQFFYHHYGRPKRERRQFDLGVFVAPVFASPIVFIPLLVSLQNADIDLSQLTIPRLMVFFVAFQNGFFWKEYFDNKRSEVGKAEA